MVSVQVLTPILHFAVLSLVQIFNNSDSGRFGLLKVRLDVFDEYGKALRPRAKLFRGRVFMPGLFQHDPGVASAHLRSAERIAIAVMLNKAERLTQPGNSFLQVSIDYVGEYCVGRYRAIGNH